MVWEKRLRGSVLVLRRYGGHPKSTTLYLRKIRSNFKAQLNVFYTYYPSVLGAKIDAEIFATALMALVTSQDFPLRKKQTNPTAITPGNAPWIPRLRRSMSS